MIITENLGKCYKSASEDLWAVKGLQLKIRKGTFISIIGRSGSGKSTLLKIIGGLLPPTEGVVKIDGVDLYSMSEKELSNYRCNRIGFIFQDYFLEEMYTVYQNIEIVLMISKVCKKDRDHMIDSALEMVGMIHKKNMYVKNLSGGEKQRVCFARAIVNEPEIIFADEPCGNLDYENSKNIMKLLRKQAQQGKTVVLITHNHEDAKLTDEVITLQDGKVIADEVMR